jgi:hypothetical protein
MNYCSCGLTTQPSSSVGPRLHEDLSPVFIQDFGAGPIYISAYTRATEDNFSEGSAGNTSSVSQWQHRTMVGSPGSKGPCFSNERDDGCRSALHS